jgi:acetyltransferase-like isoleucine patch superfamily enzyme
MMQVDGHIDLLHRKGCLVSSGVGLTLPFEYEPPVRLFHGIGTNCRFGAFSYTASRLSFFEVGRYCSIAHGVEVLSDHPNNWLSTHPFAYQDIFGQPWVSGSSAPPRDCRSSNGAPSHWGTTFGLAPA